MNQNFDHTGEGGQSPITDIEFEVVDEQKDTNETAPMSSEVLPAVRPQEGGPTVDTNELKHQTEVKSGQEWRANQRERIGNFVSASADWLSRREAFGVSAESIRQNIDQKMERVDAAIGRAAMKYDKIKSVYEAKKNGVWSQLAMFSAERAGASDEVLSALADEMRQKPRENRDRKKSMDRLKGAWEFTGSARQEAGRLLSKSEAAAAVIRKGKRLQTMLKILRGSGV